MKMLTALAFRNVLRNPRRTILTVLLIGCGLGILILYDGLVIGMSEAFVRNVTRTLVGEAQIHREGFRKEQELNLTVADWPRIQKALKEDGSVTGYAPRVVANGMLSSAHDISGVAIYGVDAGLEPGVSKLKAAVRDGEYLKGASDTEILIGARLAQRLELKLGDRVVLTAAQARGGELSQELFRVSGIFQFNSRQMDQGMVFVSLPKAQKMLGIGDNVHEVALRFKKPEDAGARLAALRSAASGNEVLAWHELMPQIKAILDMQSYGTLMTAIILVAVISLSVINSMLMSIYERLFEFGVLKALGTRPTRVALMILLESVALALISIAVGIALGAAVSGYFSRAGFDFSGMEYSGLTLTEPIRTVLTAKQFLLFPVFVLILTIIAGIYPAIHAARLVPTKAMRKSL